jgi:hypothetical protein
MSGISNATDCKSRITISNEKVQAVIWGLVKTELIGLANLNTEDRMAKIEEMTTKIGNIDADIANFTSQIANMDKQITRAYNAYIDAPDMVQEVAKTNYYNTLTKCQNEKAECESKIEGLKNDRERYELYRKSLSQPTLPSDAISKAESDPVEMRRLVKELIEKIYPYKIESYVSPVTKKAIKYGVVLLEVYAIDGIYYILYDGNQRNNKTAYYISNKLATFQNGKSKFDAYNAGEYFVIPNANMLMETEELVETATFNEMMDICATNGWEIDYTYQ